MNITIVVYSILICLIPIALYYGNSNKIAIKDGHLVETFKWSKALITAFILSVLIKGLAFDTQTDYHHYLDHINAVYSGKWNVEIRSWSKHTELGYQAFLYIIKFLHLPRFSFFILSAILLYFSTIKLSSHYRKSMIPICLIWNIFILLPSLNIYRQCYAISLECLALFYYFDKRYKLAISIIVIAFLFHKSVALAVLAFILVYYIVKTKVRINVFVIIALIFVNATLRLTVFARLYDSLESLSIFYHYSLDSILEREWESDNLWLTCIVNSIILFMADKIKYKYKDFLWIYYFCAFGFVIYPLCQQLELYRLTFYFQVFIPFVIGVLWYHHVVASKYKLSINMLVLSACIAFWVIRFYRNLISISLEYPYDLIFNHL